MSPAAAQHSLDHVLRRSRRSPSWRRRRARRRRPLAGARVAERRRDRVAHPRRDRRARARRLLGSVTHVGGARRARSRRARRSARRGAPSRTRRRAARPAATSAGAQRRRRRARGAARRAARRRRRAGRAAPRGRAGRRCGSPRSSDATTGVPAAIASSSTTPNDSPSSDGAQNTVAPRRRASLLGVGDAPEPLDARRRARARSASVCGPVARDPEHGVAVEPAPRVEQHRETLARLVAADEEHRGPRRRRRRRPSRSGRPRCRSTARRTRPSHQLRARGLARRLRHDDADASARAIMRPQRGPRPHGASSSPDAWNVPTIGPLKPMSALRHGPGHRRLVQVHDVGLEACAAPRAVRRARRAAGRDRRDRAVRVPLDARPDGHDAGLGRRAVARRDDARVDAELAQRAREPEHLALHAAGARQRVRATIIDDPHASRRLSRSTAYAGRSASSAAAGATARARARISVLELVARAPG